MFDIQIPQGGKVSCLNVNHKKVDPSVSDSTIHRHEEEMAVRVRLSVKKSKELEALILKIFPLYDNRNDMVKFLFQTPATQANSGLYLTEYGIRSAISRAVKKYGLTHGRRGRPSTEK